MEIFIILIVLVVVLVIPNIKIVPQAKAYVLERIGSYHETWRNGLHVKIPFLDRIANVVSLKEIVKDFAPQPVITKDNVTMQIKLQMRNYTHMVLKIQLMRLKT